MFRGKIQETHIVQSLVSFYVLSGPLTYLYKISATLHIIFYSLRFQYVLYNISYFLLRRKNFILHRNQVRQQNTPNFNHRMSYEKLRFLFYFKKRNVRAVIIFQR